MSAMHDADEPRTQPFACRAPAQRPSGVASLERRVLAIAAIVLLHIIVAALSISIATIGYGMQSLLNIGQPVLITLVALLMAHCSLTAIWWSHSELPSHVKTLLAALACLATWGLLLAVLAESRRDATGAAAWMASLGSQAIVAGLLAIAIELAADFRAHRGGRFSISFLLVWTAVVASLLGGGRWLAARLGWTFENFFSYEYFAQLQALAVANAVLAASLLACVRSPTSWPWRGFASFVTLACVAAGTVATMHGLFRGRVGAPLPDLAWIMVLQGLFLLVTLVPLEASRRQSSS